MAAAARTVSQIVTHMVIGFTLAYALTCSVVLGGLAILIEPVINVMVVPRHQRLWIRVRQRCRQPATLMVAAEKCSQVGLHMVVAFVVMFGASGSLAFGGLAAILEPICNVILMPVHDRLWQKHAAIQHPWSTATR